MSFFDFHTHNKDSKEKAIINIFHNEDIIPNKSLSCGIHPWYYNENYKKETNTINNLAKSKQIIAIGETGFDTVSPASIELQKTIFIEHIKLSETYNLPLIIHCVKYFHILKDLKKEFKPKQAWIIHSFNSKPEILQDLQRQGFYFTFSNTIFQIQKKAETIFSYVKAERFFLETDDSELNIENIYLATSKLLNLDIEILKNQIIKNLKDIGIWLG